MKIYNVDYKTILYKNNNYTYVLLSDFHSYFSITLANYIKDIKCDFIIISGDIMNGYKWNKNRYFNKFKDFIDIISKNHKVIISLGNHDLWGIKKEGFNNFKSLSKKNVYSIYNETCIIDNNSFTSFVPDKDCYNYFKQENINTINKVLKTKIHIPNGNYIKHLISHNPYHFYHNNIMKKIGNNFDIIEVGHFHNGFIPTKYLHNNYDKVLDKGLHELIKHIIFKKNTYKSNLKHKRILSRGMTFMYDDGYYVILPNNNVYFYNKIKKEYTKSNKKELEQRLSVEKVPPMIITGAINTSMKLKMYYPYITLIQTCDNYSATCSIKEI